LRSATHPANSDGLLAFCRVVDLDVAHREVIGAGAQDRTPTGAKRTAISAGVSGSPRRIAPGQNVKA
jgi:hypothetical protein